MTFMDKLAARIKQAARRTKKATASLLPDYNTYVARRTSPKFRGTFSPLRPLAKITPNTGTVPVEKKMPSGAKVKTFQVRRTPTRDGFLGVLPLMFGKRSAGRRQPKITTAH